ncbi:MAG TPA: radical SAM protein, partial [Nanoarchaeota archaeon]|nr:radical SAM protein [Nanoarchaeota archaeon]
MKASRTHIKPLETMHKNAFPDLSAPEIVCWDITMLCNQACLSCYNFARQHKAKNVEDAKAMVERMRKEKIDPEPTPERAGGILDALAKARVFEIDFMGGEPMCYPHIGRLVRMAHERNIISNFITNGTYVDEFLEQMDAERGELPLRDFLKQTVNHIGFSLHGNTPKPHEAFTSLAGSFKKAISGMKKLDKIGISVGILFSPYEETKHCLYDTVKMLVKKEKIRLHTVYLNRLVKVGGCRINQDIMIRETDYLKMIEQLVKVKEDFGITAKTTDGVPYCRLLSYIYREHQKKLEQMKPAQRRAFAQKYLDAVGTCYFGTNNLSLNWNGMAKMCTIPPDRFNMGDITKKPLRQIWRELSRYRHSMQWAKKCIHGRELCLFYPECRGACKITHTVNENESPANIYSEDYMKVGFTAALHIAKYFGLDKANPEKQAHARHTLKGIVPKFKKRVFIRPEKKGFLLYEASRCV